VNDLIKGKVDPEVRKNFAIGNRDEVKDPRVTSTLGSFEEKKSNFVPPKENALPYQNKKSKL